MVSYFSNLYLQLLFNSKYNIFIRECDLNTAATLHLAGHECCNEPQSDCSNTINTVDQTFDECRQQCLDHATCEYFEFANDATRCDDHTLPLEERRCRCYILTSGTCDVDDAAVFANIDIYNVGYEGTCGGTKIDTTNANAKDGDAYLVSFFYDLPPLIFNQYFFTLIFTT